MVIAEMAAAYELARWGATSAPGSGTAIDVYGGARGWWQKTDASFAANLTANYGDLRVNADGTRTASGDVSWIDPLVGLRLRHQFVLGLNLAVSGDIGASVPAATSHGRLWPSSITTSGPRAASPGAQ
jgi:hypothetical protein